MHAVYWLVTHPVNEFWLPSEKLGLEDAAASGSIGRPRAIAGNTRTSSAPTLGRLSLGAPGRVRAS